eukprot:gene37753-49447_t
MSSRLEHSRKAWYNSNKAIAFVDSKSSKAYKQAKGKSWIQDKDKKSKQSAEGKKRPQRDYESDHRGDSSRRRVSSQSRDSAHADTSSQTQGARGVIGPSKHPSGDFGRRSREPSAESVRSSVSTDRHDYASKDKGKGNGSSSRRPGIERFLLLGMIAE